ncbi:zinc ribbon domain-containing protein [Sedimentibacter sp. zth1]|uniref:zinc ribbon domain-containing protein n=1 Tax=Sedimentibacter sp. zth1 TaxID=2816908 RepID=UPI001A90CFFC|nr:zinc ribbon domain-containing protein [Sedimentibacter sp. zth1]QSX05308.1 zinc ribbon domain-containing protein [Sedimentibacter sp. zth1]
MEFFKGIGNKISKTSQEAVKKTKELAEVSRLNSEISAEERNIITIYQNIGKLYFDKYKNEECSEFAEYINNVKEGLEKIETAKEEVKLLKGKRTCPKCGAELEVETVFCSMCGQKMPEIEKEEELVEEQVEDKTKEFCASCGQELEDGAMFCPSCGTKAE